MPAGRAESATSGSSSSASSTGSETTASYPNESRALRFLPPLAQKVLTVVNTMVVLVWSRLFVLVRNLVRCLVQLETQRKVHCVRTVSKVASRMIRVRRPPNPPRTSGLEPTHQQLSLLLYLQFRQLGEIRLANGSERWEEESEKGPPSLSDDPSPGPAFLERVARCRERLARDDGRERGEE
jgi:hypothetical protein